MKKKILIVVIIIIVLLVLLIPKTCYLEVYNNLETNANTNTDETNNEQIENDNNKIILSHGNPQNLERLDKFLDNTSKYNESRISDSIEIVVYTIEGDPILHTFSYLVETNEYELTIDTTQDKFASDQYRTIKTDKYSEKEYELVKVVESDYIRIKLESEMNEEVIICAYDKNLEKNKDTERAEVSEIAQIVDDELTGKLVRYNGILYGESPAIIDYVGNPNGPIGIINKLVGEEYLPTLDGETNSEELLGAKVDSASEESMILLCNNEAVLYTAIDDTICNLTDDATYTFYAKVVSSSQNNIIVEPVEGSNELKSSDKISIALGENNDELYEVGTTVKITYNGIVLETYPAQIKPIKIEIVK